MLLCNYDGQHCKEVDFENKKDFIEALRRSKGTADKPVRILKNLEITIIVKFALSHNSRRKSLIKEHANLKLLLCDEKNHLAKIIWYSEKHDHVILCTEFIQPFFPNIVSFRDLIAHGSEIEWKVAFFQVLFTLHKLQNKYSNFKHNDLKADNILVTKGQPTTYEFTSQEGIHRKWDCAGCHIVSKIIDMEFCHDGTNFLNHYIDQHPTNKDFGLTAKKCDMYDVHLLIYDCFAMRNRNNDTVNNLYKFITKYIPEKFFIVSNLTKEFRLPIEDQNALQHNLLELMSDEYFYELRCD